MCTVSDDYNSDSDTVYVGVFFSSPHLLIPPVSQCECFIHPNQASKGLKENAYVAEKRIRMKKYRKKQHKMRSKGAGPP